MNIESNRRIEIARSEEEMYEKLELLQEQGYADGDIHVISQESNHLYTLSHHSEVSTHEAGTLMDRFKSWFTGEDAITEGLRKLNLSVEETERYADEVSRGAILLYTDLLTFADDPTIGRYDEPKDRYARGETFATDPFLVGGEKRITPEQYEERRAIKERLDEIPPKNRLY